jgi:hypothetical protein
MLLSSGLSSPAVAGLLCPAYGTLPEPAAFLRDPLLMMHHSGDVF